MRKLLRNWGAGLSDAEFACALAALGVIGPLQPSWTAAAIAKKLGERARQGRMIWRVWSQRSSLDAATYAEAWRFFRDSGAAGQVRIEIASSGALDASWLARQLSRPEVGAASVEVTEVVRGHRSPELESYGTEDPDRSPRGKGMTYSVPDGTAAPGRGRKPKPAARFLQAQLQDRTGPRKPGQIRRGLPPGASCIASIRVGVPDRRWISVDRPFPTPEEPPEPQGHRLTVIFEEPRVSPVPQVQTLWLPRTGSSEPVFFSFQAPEDGWIAARITVLHANRVLQTGVLHAVVGDGDWTFALDAVPRALLEGLAHRSQFDVALVLNHNSGGTPHLTAVAEEQVAAFDVDEGALRELTDCLNAEISAIAEHPERYEGIESPGSLELLRNLAAYGSVIHDQLCQNTRLARLADARHIQITSAKAESFLPIELFYRFRPPSETATICPHALASLEAGDCYTECPTDKREIFCPLGFWGLSRVIERHGHEPDNQERISKDFEVRAEPVHPRSLLSLSGPALLAASSKVSIVKKDAVTELLRRLKERGPTALANTWKEWEQHIEEDVPRLLILLPHHERQDRFEVLEIGEGDRLQCVRIWNEQVRRKDGPRPVVLLMGCETNLTRIQFDNPASRFRTRGAAVVVSTIATVLGRHASPATAILVELLDEMAAEERTFGEVMLRLRQKLVAKATPMALGLTSYGDADWILTRKEV